jgi:PAS domain-containing protein
VRTNAPHWPACHVIAGMGTSSLVLQSVRKPPTDPNGPMATVLHMPRGARAERAAAPAPSPLSAQQMMFDLLATSTSSASSSDSATSSPLPQQQAFHATPHAHFESPAYVSDANKQPPVSVACVSCRSGHRACNGKLPCDRCIHLGRAHLCQFAEPVPRGRRKRTAREHPDVAEDEDNAHASDASVGHAQAIVPHSSLAHGPLPTDVRVLQAEVAALRQQTRLQSATIAQLSMMLSNMQLQHQALQNQHQLALEQASSASSRTREEAVCIFITCRVLFPNAAFASLFQCKPEDLTGRHWREIVHPLARIEGDKLTARLMDSRDSADFPGCLFTRPNGTCFQGDEVLRVFMGSDRIVKAVVVSIDLRSVKERPDLTASSGIFEGPSPISIIAPDSPCGRIDAPACSLNHVAAHTGASDIGAAAASPNVPHESSSASDSGFMSSPSPSDSVYGVAAALSEESSELLPEAMPSVEDLRSIMAQYGFFDQGTPPGGV